MNNNENFNQRSENRDAPRRQPEDKKTADKFMASLPLIVAMPLILIYIEIVSHFAMFSEIESGFFVYAMFFSMAGGTLLGLLCTLFDKKVNYIITLVVIGIASVLASVQVIYFAFFGDFFQLATLGMAGNLADYIDNTMHAIFSNFHWIILIFVPFVLFAIFGRKSFAPEKANWMLRAACSVLAVCFFMLGTVYLSADGDKYGDKYIYGEGFHVRDSIGRFGIFTTARLELQYMLFGTPEPDPVITDRLENVTTVKPEDIFRPITPPPSTDSVNPGTDGTGTGTGTGTSGTSGGETTAPPPRPVDRSPQVLDIDFNKYIANASDSKLKSLLEFLSTRSGTCKNEYTGLFEGKNLIYITVEGWAPAAINEKLTPTLYMMQNEGFVFKNYYNSLWGGSTATGEYANITGNFYRSASCIRNSAKTYQKYALGNSLGALGYKTHAFHNHDYDYYGRDQSHPNFGYDWHAIGNWDVTFTGRWPESDEKLALNSLPYLSLEEPFHLYYMTVSGHAYQTFEGNSQAAKHRSYVTSVLGNDYKNQLSLSYISCQYEVELMVKALYDECERLGILEDTVFVLATDHFPYELSKVEENNQAALAELYGIPNDGDDIYNNYDLYRSPLIIWSGSMDAPVQVDKVCSATDILPTLLNLFGVEYDSRVIIGQDILDPKSDGFVILNKHKGKGDNNFITDYGIFNFKDKKFTVREGYQVDPAALEQYVSQMRDHAYFLRTYSPRILDYDLYRVIFPNG